MDNIGQSLREYLKESGITQAEMARTLGVPASYVSAVLNGRKAIGKKMAEKMQNHFGLSASWLLTGDGQMRVEEPTPKEMTITPDAIQQSPTSENAIPVYDIDFNAGFVERYGGNELERVGVIDTPAYRKATAVVSVTGDSMHPLISSGDQIILREMPCVMDSILYGGIYAVVTDNDLRTVKRIRKSEAHGCVDLEPENKEVADTTTIKFDRIISLWQVMGCIKPLN